MEGISDGIVLISDEKDAGSDGIGAISDENIAGSNRNVVVSEDLKLKV